jgi:hypothetical protein
MVCMGQHALWRAHPQSGKRKTSFAKASFVNSSYIEVQYFWACPSAPETTEQEQALVEGASGRAIRSRFFVWPAGQTKRAPLLSLTQDNLCERQSKPQPIYKEGRPKASAVSTVYPRQVRRSNVFQKTELRTNINISLIYLNHSKR